VRAAQNGWTSATSSTTAWTFEGVMVSTVPTSSPVAGLKDSSAGCAFVFPFLGVLVREGAPPLPLPPLALSFPVVRVLPELLASIAASSPRLLVRAILQPVRARGS